MISYVTKLLGREDIAQGTTAFRFARPSGFDFKPGQAVNLVIETLAGKKTTNFQHAFSLVSAPFEPELVVATRMRDSAYKNALNSLQNGAEVRIDGPFGALTLRSDASRPAIFLAGGIGITPFVSILRQAAHDRLIRDFVLIYSNRRPEDAAYLDELQQIEREYAGLHLVATMTQAAQSGHKWCGETGHINAALLQRHIADLAAPIYYLAGPPALVESMRDTLSELGVKDADVVSEEFYGY